MRIEIARAMSEAELQQQVIDLLHWHGWLVYHAMPATTRDGSTRTHQVGDPGFPDIIAARRGVIRVAELKREGRYPALRQRRWLEATAGEVWRPSDLNRIAEEIR